MLIFSTGKAETTHTSHILRYGKQEQLNLKAAPNPFNDHITFTIYNNGLHDTEIMIYTPAGRCIKTLHQTAGTFRNVYWDGTDNSGIAVRPGLYTCKITIPGKEKSVVIKKL
jgi:flagellar hook assembly protein FlgD